MRATTFIKNANKKLMKRLDKNIKDEHKAIIKALKNGDKLKIFSGIIPQIIKTKNK